MQLNIDNIDLLLSKKVPRHGKVSGIKKDRRAVRVIIPNENTKISLIVSEPSEILVRNVTMDGKILGLSNFIDKKIYVVGQNIKDLEKETGMVPLVDEWEWDEDAREALKRILELSEKHNLDPADLLHKAIEKFESREKK